MSDTTPQRRPREPAFNLPGVVSACCVVLIAIHAIRGSLSVETDDHVLAIFAFVPARLAIALDVARPQLQLAVLNVPEDTFRALIDDGGARWWSLFTYALLHGSWAHVGLNCVWLVAFGAPVARRFAGVRFLALLVVSAIVGALAQFLWSPASFVPVIGASAAVAGAMGAATRFVFRPAAEPSRVFDSDKPAAAYRVPALTMRKTFTTRGPLFFVVFWFATNLLFGLFPALGGMSGEGPIAWQAHIGGFLAGLLLFSLFDPPPSPNAVDLPIE
jgi:membrane associated rhomboid family serine protease